MQIIDGKEISKKVKNEVKIESEKLTTLGTKPTLAVILVGEDKASMTYVASKEKACKACSMGSFVYRLPKDTTKDELLKLIKKLNNDDEVHGILVQLPLPKQIDTYEILLAIDPAKDVDGFHPINVGRLLLGIDGFIPCTPLGIMRLLKEYGIEVSGKEVCVVGRSSIVGKPMANLMLNANATPTITHSRTKNLKEVTKRADIVVVAIGKPGFLTADMVKDGAVVVDVGINRLESGKLVGDVDFEAVSKKCSFITPVPGGVGPMTIAMLLSNTLKAAKDFHQKR